MRRADRLFQIIQILRRGQLKDAESKDMNFPAQYMFKDVPYSDQARGAAGPVDEPLHQVVFNAASTSAA